MNLDWWRQEMYDWRSGQQKLYKKSKVNGNRHYGSNVQMKSPVMFVVGIVLMICFASWLAILGYTHYTQAKYQLPGRVYEVKFNPNSKFVKQIKAQREDYKEYDSVVSGKDDLMDKPIYLAFGKNNRYLAVANTEKQADTWVRSDESVKKHAANWKYAPGKDDVDFNVVADNKQEEQVLGKTSMTVISGKNLKFHQNGDQVKGDWSLSFLGINMELPKDSMTVSRIR